MRANALAAWERVQARRRQHPEISEAQAIANGELAALRKAGLISRSGIPKRYQRAEWSRITVPEVADYRDDMAGKLDRGEGLLILGPVGRGKSSLASLLAMHAASLGRTVRWELTDDMLTEMEEKGTRGDHERDRPGTRRVLERCGKDVALLVLDDFGTRDLAPWQVSNLDKVIEMRYRAERSIILTTNKTKQEIKDNEQLRRVFSRLQQTCRPLTINGDEDRRRTEK